MSNKDKNILNNNSTSTTFEEKPTFGGSCLPKAPRNITNIQKENTEKDTKK